MAKTRKTRSDRWDNALTDDQRWRAFDVFGRSKWAEFKAWAETELAGVKIPSRNSMYDWHADMSDKEADHKIRQSREARDEIGVIAKTAALDEDLIAAYKSMGARAALLGNKDEAVKLTMTAIDLANLQLNSGKLKLQRDRFEAQEARLSATRDAVARLNTSGKLTAEARAEIERAMGIM